MNNQSSTPQPRIPEKKQSLLSRIKATLFGRYFRKHHSDTHSFVKHSTLEQSFEGANDGQNKPKPRSKFKSDLKSIGFVLVVIFTTVGWFASSFIFSGDTSVETSELDTASQPRSTKIFSVQVMNSTAKSYTRTQKFAAQLQAVRRTKISTKINSTIKTVPVAMGQAVRKGTPIITLDPDVYPANLEKAKALLKKQEIMLNTIKRLHAKGSRSDTQLSDAQANHSTALANYISAKEQNDGITIRAPYTGVMESISTEIGEEVQNGTVVATLSDMATIKTLIYASEGQIDQIAMGQTVTLTLRNGKTLQGRVTRVGIRANEKTRTFPIEIHAKNTVNAKDGFTASAILKIGTMTAHKIPPSALTLKDNGTFGVRAVQNNKVIFYPVTIEQESNGDILVSDLPNKIQLITVGQEYVRAGDTVSVTVAP